MFISAHNQSDACNGIKTKTNSHNDTHSVPSGPEPIPDMGNSPVYRALHLLCVSTSTARAVVFVRQEAE